MIKKFAIGVVGVVVACAAVALALPREWKVTRSIVIAAPPTKVYPLIADLKRWQDWSPWTRELDPSLRNIYEGPADGVGAKWAWLGPKMGRGQITIVEAEPTRGLKLLQAIESDAVNSTASISFEPEAGATRVTWRDEGTLPLLGGLFLGTVEERLGGHFERGLQKLKALAEN